MKLSEKMKEKQLLSFELFPPKTEKGMANLPGTIEHLMEFKPEYISCTYGAGGGNVGANREVCQMIKKAGSIPVTHFTVIKNTKEGIREQLDQYLEEGVDHMLALRGDFPMGETSTMGDFNYATDLVKFVRDQYGDRCSETETGQWRRLHHDTALLGYGTVQILAGCNPKSRCYHAGRRRSYANSGSGSYDQYGTVT